MKINRNEPLKKSWRDLAATKRSWDDITVDDFSRIQQWRNETEEDLMLHLVAMVLGISFEDVLDMPISILSEHMEDINFLLSEPRIPLMKPSYTIGGTVYRVYSGEFTTAQYIDFKQMASDYPSNITSLLTVFLIPEGKKYASGYDLAKARQDMGKLPITAARAVVDFFLTACALSMRIFLRSSRRRIRKEARHAEGREKEILLSVEKEITKVLAKPRRQALRKK